MAALADRGLVLVESSPTREPIAAIKKKLNGRAGEIRTQPNDFPTTDETNKQGRFVGDKPTKTKARTYLAGRRRCGAIADEEPRRVAQGVFFYL